MPFKANLKKLELNPVRVVNPLLKQVREIWDKGQMPQAKEGCKDCQLLGKMMKLSQ